MLNRETLLLTALLSAVTVAADVIVKLEVSENVVKVNQVVRLTCRVEGITDSTLVNFNKVVIIDEITHREPLLEPIATLTTVLRPYNEFHQPGSTNRRFSVSRTVEGSSHVYILEINGVQLEDTGRYSCQIPDFNKYDVKQLEVYRVPESVVFLNRNESEEVEVIEGHLPANVTCRVSRVVPYPDVKITVGDTDVTHDFLTSTSTMHLCTDVGKVGKTCPLHDVYNVTAEPREFKPSYVHNGKELKCTATTRYFEKDEIHSSVTLNVKYAPKINCTSPLTVKINQTEVEIRCTVFANPISSPENITWIIKTGYQENRLRSPLLTDKYSITSHIVDEFMSRTEHTLKIELFTDEFFGSSYILEQINNVGQSTFEIKVNKENTGVTGQGIRLILSPAILLMTVILAFISSIH